MNAEELKALRVPLILLVIIVALSGAAVYYTDGLARKAAAELQQRQNDLRTAQTRMQQSGSEKDLIVQYVDKYRELEKIGFAGDEQRINWLDALRDANTRAELFGISYQIGIQHPYPYAAQFDPGPVLLRESIMDLDMRLLHEGDLFRFFEALKAQKAGLFHINECALLRTDSSATLRNQPNLNAKCKIAWITAATAPPGELPK